MKGAVKKTRPELPRVGTEFKINGRDYVVTHAETDRFSAVPKEVGREKRDSRDRRTIPASIFDPDDWTDEYHDGRHLLDPEPEEWGWRNVKQRVI